MGSPEEPESSGGSASPEEKKKIGEEINADVFKKERAKAVKAVFIANARSKKQRLRCCAASDAKSCCFQEAL